MVVGWFKGGEHIGIIFLSHLFHRISELRIYVTEVTIEHMYRESNTTVDLLLKEALLLQEEVMLC